MAGLLGLVATVNASGVGDALGDALVALMPFSPETPAANFGWLLALGSTLGLAVTSNGVPALLTPMAKELAAATGFPSRPWCWRRCSPLHRHPALSGAAHHRGAGTGEGADCRCDALALASSALTFLLLAPLDYTWWRWLGVI